MNEIVDLDSFDLGINEIVLPAYSCHSGGNYLAAC
jgi:hypothetical protein